MLSRFLNKHLGLAGSRTILQKSLEEVRLPPLESLAFILQGARIMQLLAHVLLKAKLSAVRSMGSGHQKYY